MEFAAGKWRVKAWEGGYPVWIEIHHTDMGEETELIRIHHSELRDLEYLIDRLMDRVPEMLPGHESELK